MSTYPAGKPSEHGRLRCWCGQPEETTSSLASATTTTTILARKVKEEEEQAQAVMEGGGGSSGGAPAKAPAEGAATFQEESAVRRAEPQDCATIMRYVHAMAHFHNMPDAVHIDLQQLENAMFKSNPRQLWAFLATIRRRDTGKALVAAEEAPAGMVIFHYRYSAVQGGRILYIEDLFVSEEYRGRGLGVALLRAACEQALHDTCRAVQFKVHKDNKGAQRLYLKNGAVDQSEAGDVRLFFFDRDSRFPHSEEKEKAR